MFEQLKSTAVRAALTAAAESTGNREAAAENLSKAFHSLIEEVRTSKLGRSDPKAFFFGEDEKSSMQEVLFIQALGVDFMKYHKFKTLVDLRNFGPRYVYANGRGKLTTENIWWSIDFIAELALKIEGFAGYDTFWELQGKPKL